MKSPKTKKVVRAWGLMRLSDNDIGDQFFLTRSGVKEMIAEAAAHNPCPDAMDEIMGRYKIIPCVISYEVPTKKSAGKVGKRV